MKDKKVIAFLSTIGKKGGTKTKTKHGPEFYSTIGKKGVKAKKQKVQKAH